MLDLCHSYTYEWDMIKGGEKEGGIDFSGLFSQDKSDSEKIRRFMDGQEYHRSQRHHF